MIEGGTSREVPPSFITDKIIVRFEEALHLGKNAATFLLGIGRRLCESEHAAFPAVGALSRKLFEILGGGVGGSADTGILALVHRDARLLENGT